MCSSDHLLYDKDPVVYKYIEYDSSSKHATKSQTIHRQQPPVKISAYYAVFSTDKTGWGGGFSIFSYCQAKTTLKPVEWKKAVVYLTAKKKLSSFETSDSFNKKSISMQKPPHDPSLTTCDSFIGSRYTQNSNTS